MRFKVEDYELIETFEPIKKSSPTIREGRGDRSRSSSAKALSQARKRQRKAKFATI